jgi:hypothetical protein
MNSSIVYVYLGIVMIIVLATTFYVRTIKTKLDTKVDAMFQLVQSLVNEVNQLKSSQLSSSKPKEVIQLDINSSNNKLQVSEHEESDDEESDDEESDDESYDSSDSDNEKELLNKTIDLSNDSPHQVNMHSEVAHEVAHEVAQEVAVQEVAVQEVAVQEVAVQEVAVQEVAVQEVAVQELDIHEVSLDLPEVDVEEVEIKAVQLESNEIKYEKLTVKELKEMVTKKGGKANGKKKGELIEFLLS